MSPRRARCPRGNGPHGNPGPGGPKPPGPTPLPRAQSTIDQRLAEQALLERRQQDARSSRRCARRPELRIALRCEDDRHVHWRPRAHRDQLVEQAPGGALLRAPAARPRRAGDPASVALGQPWVPSLPPAHHADSPGVRGRRGGCTWRGTLRTRARRSRRRGPCSAPRPSWYCRATWRRSWSAGGAGALRRPPDGSRRRNRGRRPSRSPRRRRRPARSSDAHRRVPRREDIQRVEANPRGGQAAEILRPRGCRVHRNVRAARALPEMRAPARPRWRCRTRGTHSVATIVAVVSVDPGPRKFAHSAATEWGPCCTIG